MPSPVPHGPRARLLVSAFLAIAISAAADVTIVERGPNHNVLQSPSTPGAPPRVWTQLEDGLNYWDEATRSWQPARAEIELAESGAVALRGQIRALFSPNANDPQGALDLDLGNGVRLRSSVLALRYFDPLTGADVVLAMARDAAGELIPPNQVIYRDAFDNLHADIVYTYRASGVEADVVLREIPPSPAAFGLPAETTRLEVITEFFDPPRPAKQRRLLDAIQDPNVRQLVAEPDWKDEELRFNGPRIGAGRAFAWSARDAAQASPRLFAPVGKEWIQQDNGRALLIESVEYIGIFHDLQALPGKPDRLRQWRETAREWAGLDPALLKRRAFEQWTQPSLRHPEASRAAALALTRTRSAELRDEELVLAVADSPRNQPGVVIDWTVLTAGTSDFTFKSTRTYHVTGDCWFTGKTTLEGGAVIKFPLFTDNVTGITIDGAFVSRTRLYRPAVLTSDRDNTVGESILLGVPDPTANYGARLLRFRDLGAPVVVEHLQIRHGHAGLVFEGDNPRITVRHCQFLNCEFPVQNTASTPVSLRNVLITDVKPSGAVLSGVATPFVGEHLTIHSAPSLLNGGSLALTNSVLVGIAAIQSYAGGFVHEAASPDGLYQAVAAGGYYLAPQSPLRDAGAPAISPDLARDLATLTTDPPILIQTNITSLTSLTARARRDTDTPDLGYHYPPLDYVLNQVTVSHATVRIAAGAAVGMAGSSGLVLGPDARLLAQGTPVLPARLVRHSVAQEQAMPALAPGEPALLGLNPGAASAPPQIDLVFVEASMPAGPEAGRHFLHGSHALPAQVRLQHSGFEGISWTLSGAQPGSLLSITNNRFMDATISISQLNGAGQHPVPLVAFNNLFLGGALSLNSQRADTPWIIQDNLFAPDSLSASIAAGTLSHNGFRDGLAQFGASNRTGLALDFAPGLAGPFTYPVAGGATSLASLIDAGSRSATVARLYHATTRSDQAPEQDTTVDIGFHYIAPANHAAGLVGHWRLDELGGTEARDASALGLHGALLNGATWIRGVNGGAVQFDGVNDRISIPDSPPLRLTNAFTIAFWARKDAESADQVRYVGKGASTPRNFGVWDEAGSSGRILFQFRSLDGTLRATTSVGSVPVGEWHHIACSWENNQGRIYIDGRLDNSATMEGPPQTSSDPLTFGDAGYNGRLQGALDDVRVYNRALSPSEIGALLREAPPAPLASGLLGHWALDAASGTHAADTSPLAQHGVVSGGAQWIAGEVGNALQFDGLDDQVTIPDTTALRLTRAFSIAFWVRKSGEPADSARIVGKGSSAFRNYGVWDVGGPSQKLRFQFRDTSNAFRELTTVGNVPVGVWRHVVCAWDGAIGRIYLDGVLDTAASMPGTPLVSADPLTFGYAGYGAPFVGDLDEVVILDRAATEAEARALMGRRVATTLAQAQAGYWNFEESSGVQVRDVSGGALHGTAVNGPARVPGLFGRALSFDGVNDQVTIPDAPHIRFASGYTLSAWIRKQSESAQSFRYLGKGTAASQNYGLWDAAGASDRVLSQFRNTLDADQSVQSQSGATPGEWRHIAATWDGAVGRVYLDGVLDAIGAMTGPPRTSGDPLTLGFAGFGGFFAGQMDEVGLYNRALSPDEILRLAVSAPPDSDGDNLPDALEDANGNGIQDPGETSAVEMDSDFDGRTDEQEFADGTDPLNAGSYKPVQLSGWTFNNPLDPWATLNGHEPVERSGVALVPLETPIYGADFSDPNAVLRYNDIEGDGTVNINPLQGAVSVSYIPHWASDSPDCSPGTRGTGPGARAHLFSIGEFSVVIDARGTNIMLLSPDGAGGTRTNLQAPFLACEGDIPPDFPLGIQVSYSTNATALFFNGELAARGSGIAAPPSPAARAAGLFIGSNPRRAGQARGVIESLITFNVPLDMCTNAWLLAGAVAASQPAITLDWAAINDCFYRVERQALPDGPWTLLSSAKPPSFTDASAVRGQAYQYRLSPDYEPPANRFTQYDPAYAVFFGGADLPPNDDPGDILLVVDRTLTNAPAFRTAVTALTESLSAEGWRVKRFDGPRHDDNVWANNPPRITEVKSWITEQYVANPDRARAILLFGHIPVPRSGMLSPDGHKHRPLPTDAYYADIDGVWTDATNFPAPPLVEFPNVAGDGIFDQELIPPNSNNIARVELAVGRVDFAGLPAFAEGTPSLSEADLFARYVAKTRAFRRAQTTVPERVIYEAFFSTNEAMEKVDNYARRIRRLAHRLEIAFNGSVGSGAGMEEDFFIDNLPAVWGIQGGYGGGVHLLNSIEAVNNFHGSSIHETRDLVDPAKEPPIAFSMTEHSWVTQWNETNHLGRALLATPTYGFAWLYGGPTRIEWQTPLMALGYSLGDAWTRTQNDAWMFPYIATSWGAGTGVRRFTGARFQGGYTYATLLGDPTLRQAPLPPPGPVSGATNASGHVTLTWQPSPASGATYLVYRTTQPAGGAWTRLTATPVSGTTWTDTDPPTGPRAYLVRALARKTIAAGSYTNISAGSIWPGWVQSGASIQGRHVFYNQSAWDGNHAEADAADDAAIAPDKQALRPGQTATFANYTSYSRGINGIMIDILNLPATPTPADFSFRIGNDNNPDGWSAAPPPSSIAVRQGAGINGSDRVTLIWANGAIAKTWLQVTVLPTIRTGLDTPDVFYFGNAIGESGNEPTRARVDPADEILAYNNQRSPLDPAPIDSRFDFNRDRRVDPGDQLLARNNQTFALNELKLIQPPP